MGVALSKSQRTSLAEFTRLYLQSQTSASDASGDPASHGPQTFENGFATQVFRGMSKGDPESSSENDLTHLIDAVGRRSLQVPASLPDNE
jgi:hypothetical protein